MTAPADDRRECCSRSGGPVPDERGGVARYPRRVPPGRHRAAPARGCARLLVAPRPRAAPDLPRADRARCARGARGRRGRAHGRQPARARPAGGGGDARRLARPGDDRVVDDAALSTAENAAHVRDVALELGVEEVVVVTSRWHSARAAALVPREPSAAPASASPPRRRPPPARRRCSRARRSASSRSLVQLRPRRPLRALYRKRAAGSKRSLAVSVGTRVG